MNRDPLRQQIIDALNREVDGDTFEACMCAVLQKEWPTLVPVPGGDDAGADGSWVDEDGRGILVATTQKDVIGNVTRNLKQHIAKGRSAIQVLVVTSRHLTARRCRNIEKRVRELGFISAHHPYTQQAVATRLYHNARWLKELLGIAGGVSALSTVPRGTRPFRELPTIERECELQWLRDTNGDRLLVGQPGIGKTFLCQTLVNDGQALFATLDDMVRLADAIRDQQPTAVIVEDAHLKLNLLTSLHHFREDTGVEFSIIADCWPGAVEGVSDALNLPRTQRLEVMPLSGEAIVELVKGTGIHGPDVLLHHIVRQSMGCPGRASLLAFVCHSRRDFNDIIDGRAFADWAYPTFSKLVGERSKMILAGFALGGERGMSARSVASWLEYPLGDVLQDLSKLALGGVVYQNEEDVYRVVPSLFRVALVKDHFFSRATRIPYRELLESSPSPASAVECVIHAFVTGAEISLREVFQLVERVNHGGCWEAFLWIDETAARLACDHYPALLSQYPKALLHNVPELMIPELLEASISDDRPLHGHPELPLRQIEDWIHGARPPGEECLSRRHALWQSVKEWLVSGHCQRTGLKALASVVTPKWETQIQDPGNRRSFQITWGCLPPDDLEALGQLWTEILIFLDGVEIEDWRLLFEAAHNWFYPAIVTRKLPAEYHDICQKSAREILTVFAKMAVGRPGVLSSVEERARHLDFDIDVEIDADYSCLFPDDPVRDDRGWKIREQEQVDAVTALASTWVSMDPWTVMPKLVWCANESKSKARVWPDYSNFVATQLAIQTDAPEDWLTAAADAGAAAGVVLPFLDRVAVNRGESWLKPVLMCLRHPELKSAGLSVIVVAIEEFKEAVEAEIESVAAEMPDTIERLCWDVRIPAHRLQRFLLCDNSILASATAEGMWDARRKEHAIPDELVREWRIATVTGSIDGYKLAEICKADSVFAFEWLTHIARNSRASFNFKNDAVPAAIEALSIEQRASVLRLVDPARYASQQLVVGIVGTSTELFQQLLADDSKRDIHLDPLSGQPSENWARMAIIALGHGYSKEDVTRAAFKEVKVECGPASIVHKDRSSKWETLLTHSNCEVQQIAEIGRKAELATAAQMARREEDEAFFQNYG